MPHKGLQTHPETEEERRARLLREQGGQSLPSVRPKTPEGILSEDKERVGGVTLPSGETFLGLTKEEIALFGRKELEKTALPLGVLPGGTTIREEEERRKKLELVGQVGVIDPLIASQVEEQGLNVREFLHAGLQNIDLRTAVVAAGGGAAAGIAPAIPTGGVSVAALAVVGGGGSIINDFQKGVRKNIKAQREDLVSVKTKELRQRKLAITNYISAANMNPAAADDYVLAMGIELSLIRRDFNTLTQKGEDDLEFWGSDATRQIAEYNVFFESVEPSLIIRMEQAVLKPDPTRAFIQFEAES